jgi:hypothetical protein
LKGNPTDEVGPEGYQIEVPPVDPNPKTKAMRNSPEYIHTDQHIYHHFTTTSELTDVPYEGLHQLHKS